MPARPIAVTSMPSAASPREPWRSAAIPGERRGDEHADRHRRELEAGHDRRRALRPLEVEDEEEHQREAREAVQERRGGRGGEEAVVEELEVEHRRRAVALDQDEERQQDERRRRGPPITSGFVPAGEAALRQREARAR